MRQEINWSKGTPKEIGQHFVAVQVGQGAGWYDFMDWDGEKWNCRSTEEIIAFLSLQDFVKQLKIKWPGAEPEQSTPPKLSDDAFDFREVI